MLYTETASPFAVALQLQPAGPKKRSFLSERVRVMSRLWKHSPSRQVTKSLSAVMRTSRAVRTVARSGPGRRAAVLGLWFGGGCLLAAAAVEGRFQPLALGLLCAGTGGWNAVAAALGAALGYLWFWGRGAAQALCWLGAGLAVSLTLGDAGISRRQTLLLPACAAVIVAGGGVLWLFRWGDETPIPTYP